MVAGRPPGRAALGRLRPLGSWCWVLACGPAAGSEVHGSSAAEGRARLATRASSLPCGQMLSPHSVRVPGEHVGHTPWAASPRGRVRHHGQAQAPSRVTRGRRGGIFLSPHSAWGLAAAAACASLPRGGNGGFRFCQCSPAPGWPPEGDVGARSGSVSGLVLVKKRDLEVGWDQKQSRPTCETPFVSDPGPAETPQLQRGASH